MVKKKTENSVTGAKLRLYGSPQKTNLQRAKRDRPNGPRQVSGAAKESGARIVQASRKSVTCVGRERIERA